MAFYDETGFGTTVGGGGDAAAQNIAGLSSLQAPQALSYGQQAAALSDPFASQRGQYQNQLSTLLSNPGSFASSPAYQFAYDQGLNALQRKGNVHSGNKLAQLMQYGQGMASQLYGQQAAILSPLAMSGSSPGAAGIAFASGANRSQDYNQLAAASRGAAQGQPTATNQQPWWAQPSNAMGAASSNTAIGGYGYGGMPGGMSGQIDYGTPGYTPSSNAGTGYASSNGNTTTFGQYDPFSDPYWSSGVASDVLGGSGSSGDFYGDYGDFGSY